MRIPAVLVVGIGGVRVVVGTHARAIRRVGPVATEKAHIVHQRVCACLPQRAHRAAVDTAREEADARDDVMASLWRLKQCLRCAGALKGRGCVGQVELRHAGVQADQHGVRAEFDRIRYKIAAHGNVEHRVLRNCSLNCCCVVGDSVAFHAEGLQIDP